MANGKKFTEFRQFISLIVTIAIITAGAVVWATSEHADNKDWTVEQDRVIKTDIEGQMKEHYVPKHEFTPVQTDIKNIKDMLTQMNTKLDAALRERRGD
jgi:hypothetical protein